MAKVDIVAWPESQTLYGYEGAEENCVLINSEKGIEEYGFSAYIVDRDWYTKVKNGEVPYSDDNYDKVDEDNMMQDWDFDSENFDTEDYDF